MGGEKTTTGLVWSIDHVLSRVEKEARYVSNAKYLDIAISQGSEMSISIGGRST